jgi:hypothetical protein
VERRADRNVRFVPFPFAVVEDTYRSIPGNFERLARISDSAVLKDGLSKGPDGRQTMELIMEYNGGRMISLDAAKASAFRRKYGRRP